MNVAGIMKFRPANDRAAGAWTTARDWHDAAGSELAILNGVAVSAAVLRSAIDAIKHLQIACDAGAVQHAEMLAELVSDLGLQPEDEVASALHARAIALDRWCARHDPYGRTDIDALFEAAARCPLMENAEGLGFDAGAFRDLMSFINELPF